MRMSWVLTVVLFSASALAKKTEPRSVKGELVICSENDAVDLVFLLDASKSVGFKNYGRVVGFVQDFVNVYEIGPGHTRIGLVYFSVKATKYMGLADFADKQAILDHIGLMSEKTFKNELGGRTNTSGGLAVVHSVFHASPRTETDAKMVILISDGKPNSDKELTVPNADKLKADGIQIMTIGVGNSIRRDNLELIASEPFDSYVFTTKNFNDLISKTQELIATACKNVEYLKCPPHERSMQILAEQHAAIDEAIADLQNAKDLLWELDHRCNVNPCPSCFVRNDDFKSCYIFVAETVSWADADRLCARLYGARLASLNSAEEFNYIKGEPFNDSGVASSGIDKWWISGNDLMERGTLMWAGDGHSVKVDVTGDPDTGRCVFLDGAHNLRMTRGACGVAHGFVCERGF
ncbi:collagen alpha-4(VI) chain [Lingula anatina]|uniref:Collagen alpha-4(VI) chain n=1 Tax=Lingula anatina TaxID=7574 RepID=A0A1S3JH07_LINAN|nr:collagen alpha-4(VI) chain [Lingula anatina]|eukprot:XP_013409426.1 collagen alpha-4(VI) chain [Lingula anatina]